MKRESDEQKALAPASALKQLREASMKKWGRKTREKPGLFSISVHSAPLSKHGARKPNKLIQGGFCAHRVSSANPAPQTGFKGSLLSPASL